MAMESMLIELTATYNVTLSKRGAEYWVELQDRSPESSDVWRYAGTSLPLAVARAWVGEPSHR